MSETARSLTFQYSKMRLLLLFLGSVGFVVTCIALTYLPRQVPPGSATEFICYIGACFFGLCAAIAFWRLFSPNRDVITLTAAGIRDIRVAAEEIPWLAIQVITVCTINKQDIIVLKVEEDVEEYLTLTKIAKWSRGPNLALGVDGLCVTATAINVEKDRLLSLIGQYWQAARQGGGAEYEGEFAVRPPLR